MRRARRYGTAWLAAAAFLLPAVAAAQVGETAEVQWTNADRPELREEAARLGTVARIYEFVRNEFEYMPYHGARMTSVAAFAARRGNDVDLASVLIAMLRSRGIPARYATSEVVISSTLARRWLGTESTGLSRQLLLNSGVSSPSSNPFTFEHVWVQALVALEDYRGEGPATGVDCATQWWRCRWVDLDPSLKDKAYPSGSIDLYDAVTFDYTALWNAEVAGYSPQTDPSISRAQKSPLEIFEEQILAYLRANHPGKTLEDVARPGRIVAERSGLLPSSLPFKLAPGASIQTFDSVEIHDILLDPDWSKDVTVDLFFPNPAATQSACNGTPARTHAVPLAAMSSNALTIRWETSTTPHRMVLRLGGQLLGVLVTAGETVGNHVVDLGSPFQVRLAVEPAPPVPSHCFDGKVVGGFYDLVAGGHAGSWAELHRATDRLVDAANDHPLLEDASGIPHVDANGNGVIDGNEPPLNQNDQALAALTGGLLASARALYLARYHDLLERGSALYHSVSLFGNVFMVTSTVHEVEYIDGAVFSFRPNGLLVDIAAMGDQYRWDQSGTRSGKAFELIAAAASAMEHEVWQELTGYRATSTISGIQQALAGGASLVHAARTAQNMETLTAAYPAFGFSVGTPPAGVTPTVRSMFGRQIWSWRGNAGDYLDLFKATAPEGTPPSRRSFYQIPLDPAWLDDKLAAIDAQEDQLLALGSGNWVGVNVCSGAIHNSTAAAALSALQSCFQQNFVNPNQAFFNFIDGAAGFVPSEYVYRITPTSALAQPGNFLARTIRDQIYPQMSSYDNRVREILLPSQRTAGDDMLMRVYYHKELNTDGSYRALTFGIASDQIQAGGGWVSARNPLLLSDVNRFNNQLLNDFSRISIVNNDLFRTPSTFDPVSTVTGNMYHDETDLRIRGRGLDYLLTRTYNSLPSKSNADGKPMGFGWTHSYAMKLVARDHGLEPNKQLASDDDGVVSSVIYVDERGGELAFGVSGGPAIASWTVTQPRGRFETLVLTDAPTRYVLRFPNGVEYEFGDANLSVEDATARLKEIRDPYGARLTLEYDEAGNLHWVRDNLQISWRTGLEFGHVGGRLEWVRDWSGRQVRFGYDADGNLDWAQDAMGRRRDYQYAPGTHDLVKIVLPEDRDNDGVGDVEMRFGYLPNSKAYRNANAFGEGEAIEYDIHYRLTRVADPHGHVRTHHFDRHGQLEKLEEPDGGILLFDHTGKDGLRFRKRNALGWTTEYSYNTSRQVAGCEADNPPLATCQANAAGQVTLERDALGNRIEYTYTGESTFRQLAQIKTVASDGTTTSFETRTYYPNDSQQPNGAATPWAKRGRLFRRFVTLDGQANVLLEENEWNDDGTLRRRIEYIEPGTARTRTTTYSYRAGTNGLEIEQILVQGGGKSIRKTFTYDNLGRVKTETLHRRRSYTDATELALTTTYEYDSLDRVWRRKDPLGNYFDTKYDFNGNVETVEERWKPPTGSYVQRVMRSYFYDDADRLVEERDVFGASTRYGYDAAGNRTSVTDANGNTTRYEYDAMNRRTAVVDPNGHRREFRYDLAGRLVEERDPNGRSTLYEYDPLGRLVAIERAIDSSRTARTLFGYDSRGNPQSKTDANAVDDPAKRNAFGVSEWRVFDELGRLRRVVDAHDEETIYGYDLLGNRTFVQDALGQTTNFVYDDLGRLVEVRDPRVESPDKVVQLDYDEAGNLIRKLDRMGQETHYVYDALQRLEEARHAVGTLDELMETRTYKFTGELESASNPDITYTYFHDDAHRLTSVQGGGKILGYSYDDVGNVKSRTSNFGAKTTYVYDSANRLVSLTNPDSVSVSYHYGPAGNLINRTLSNGAQTDYEYDLAYRITRVRNETALGTVQNVVYGRDLVGNVVSTTDSVLGESTFSYDDLHRLRVVDMPGTEQDRCYHYDAVGNRIAETLAASCEYANSEWLYSTGNRLNSIVVGWIFGQPLLASDGFQYDDNGRMSVHSSLVDSGGEAAWRTLFLGYDAKGRVDSATVEVRRSDNSLVSSATHVYKYDPFDYRIEKTVGGTGGGTFKYHWEGEHLEAVSNGSDQLIARFLRGVVIDEVVSASYKEGSASWLTPYTYHHDWLQSVTDVSSHRGASVWRRRYTPFGEIALTSGTLPRPKLEYTGRELDEETGLYYYRARYYNPRLGRFLQEDPMGFAGGINFYAYVRNNPLAANDPMGLIEQHTSLTGASRVFREIADIFEIEGSFGLQGSLTATFGPTVNGSVTLDLGSERYGWSNAGYSERYTESVELGIEARIPGTSVGVNLSGGILNELPYVPRGESLNGASYLLDRWGTQQEYAAAELGPWGGAIGTRVGTDNTDLRMGGGGALIFGVEGYVNLSEMYDAGIQGISYVSEQAASALLRGAGVSGSTQVRYPSVSTPTMLSNPYGKGG